GRPAAPAGLAFYGASLQAANAPTDIVNLQAAYSTNAAVKNLINSLESSSESLTLYPTTNYSVYVTDLFQALFNRAPTTATLNSYVASLSNGSVPVGDAALSIMAGAMTNTSSQGLIDAATVTSKAAIASNFTGALTPTQANAYSGTKALTSGRDMLKQVTNTT